MTDDYENPEVEERWCTEQRTQIVDYGIKKWNASDLSISSWWLPKTVSHRLWLRDNEPAKFIEKRGKIVGLHLFTRKGSREIFF